jgi:GTP-binding protein
MLPIVSIIGRPNVGKSSLFNRIAGRKIAVVDDYSGVTRDRNYADASWVGTDFTVVDTGGFVPSSKNRLVGSINEQVGIAIDESSAIIFCVDAGTGPADIDVLIAKKLRRECRERVIVAINKAESPSASIETGEFLSLGCGEPARVSALHGTGVADLLDRVVEIIVKHGASIKPGKTADISVAVLGRPNAGKSLFVNKLLNCNRMIVDDEPGTTRDAIDSFVTHEGKTVRIIDTAGLRRKSQVKNQLEYYTNVRSLDSLERCDVAVLMIDAAAGAGSQDLKILAQVLKARKGAIACLNKWDIVEKDHRTFDKLAAEIREQYAELRHIPMVSISALTGQRTRTVLDIAFEVRERMTEKVNQGEFRTAMFEWTRTKPHPNAAAGEVRFLGGKQLDDFFPHFLFFCTNPKLVQTGYERFLINNIYETFGFEGCPVGVTFRPPGKPGRRPPQAAQV